MILKCHYLELILEENDGEQMSNDGAVKLMGEIKDRLKQVNGARNSLLQPFDTLSNLILEIIFLKMKHL